MISPNIKPKTPISAEAIQIRTPHISNARNIFILKQ